MKAGITETLRHKPRHRKLIARQLDVHGVFLCLKDSEMKLMNMTSTMTMSSLEIAELTGKEHKHVLRDIRKLLSSTGFTAIESTYKDSRNRPRPCCVMDADNAQILINTYSTLRYSMSAREKDCLATIEQVLGITLEKQFSVGKYKIDGYDIVYKVDYEIDEVQNKSVKHQQADREREAYICSILGCAFKRIAI